MGANLFKAKLMGAVLTADLGAPIRWPLTYGVLI